MPPKAVKVELPGPGHWDRISPPADQELWRQYMNEDDSDSDALDTEEGEMTGPSSTSKTTKPEALEGKPKPKNDLIKEVLDDAFNDQIFEILNGGGITKEASEKRASEEPASKAKEGHEQPSKDPNPSSSDLEICSNCSLPRLKHPRIGLNSRPSPDPNAQYCANEPPIVLASHDVHGNAFPGFKPKNTTNTTTTTNTASAVATTVSGSKPSTSTSTNNATTTKPASKPAATEATSPSNSQSSTSTPPITTTTTAEYPQIRTPQMKCPNSACNQWKTVNVMAKHLDACLLGKGRRAGREARERIGAGSGSGNGTPGEGGSRAGTPRPGGAGAVGIGGGWVKRGRDRDGKGDRDGEGGGGGKKQKKGK